MQAPLGERGLDPAKNGLGANTRAEIENIYTHVTRFGSLLSARNRHSSDGFDFAGRL
jgi:hypothetical protein